VKNARTGAATVSAVPSECPSAMPFGTELAEHDVHEREQQVGERDRERCRHPGAERPRQRLLAEGADAQRGQRDAELHRRDEARRVARDAQHVARSAVALMVELDDPRAPGRDEAVLGRDEERVEQDQDCNADELVEKSHAPTPGALVLGGISSTRLRRSIGHGAVVLDARRPTEAHEPFQVRQRLRDGETPLDRR